ncbi:hypothetical protein RIF29_16581 [Crotalaria pallida]|uniref:NAC domain-containing protein n=1 Tax=Crotalaria pallida TaxID=3830 RepID=A0AAN9FGW8_CROPI
MGSPASMEQTVPVGYRFHPTDEELVDHYLKHKLLGHDSMVHNIIAEVDLCKFEPSDLPGKALSPIVILNSYPVRTGLPPVDRYLNFVLCRLMEKAEKKTESGIDAFSHGEGGPNSHIATGYENQVTVDRIPNVYAPQEVNLESTSQAQPQVEKSALAQPTPPEEPYFLDSRFPNIYSENENITMQYPFEITTEEDDYEDFLKRILADKRDNFSDEAIKDFVNEISETDSEQPLAQINMIEIVNIPDTLDSIKEQRKAQGTSSRKNLETTSNQSSGVNREGSSICLETPLSVNLIECVNIPDTPSWACNEHTRWRENTMMSIASLDAAYAGLTPNEINLENKDSTLKYNFCYLNVCIIRQVSSSASTSRASSPSPSRRHESKSPSPRRANSRSPSGRWKSVYHPRSHNFASLIAAARKSTTHRKVSSQEVSQQAVKRMVDQSNKVQIHGNNLRKKVQTKCVKGKGSFKFMETPLVQSSWLFFTWSCALSCYGFGFHHRMIYLSPTLLSEIGKAYDKPLAALTEVDLKIFNNLQEWK